MTRFDVVVTRRIKETQSIKVDGAPGPSESELIAETIDRIVCSWCGDADSVTVLGGSRRS